MEMSFYDVYKIQLEFEGGDKRRAVESTLSLVTGGLFDACEGESRERQIDGALEAMKNIEEGSDEQ